MSNFLNERWRGVETVVSPMQSEEPTVFKPTGRLEKSSVASFACSGFLCALIRVWAVALLVFGAPFFITVCCWMVCAHWVASEVYDLCRLVRANERKSALIVASENLDKSQKLS